MKRRSFLGLFAFAPFVKVEPMVELKNEPCSISPGRITYINQDNGKRGFWPLFEVSPADLHRV